MERKLETKIVKDALTKAGYKSVRVKHGRGTAWGWLDIKAEQKPSQTWQEYYDDINKIAQDVTRRRGDYNGRINVD